MTSDKHKPTAVKAATPETGGAYESLALALEGRFDVPLRELPDALRERVEQSFPPVIWDEHSAEHRRHRAREWDCETDPAAEEKGQAGFDSGVRQGEIEIELRQLELMNPRTPLELESKNRQMDALRRELTELQGAGTPTQDGNAAASIDADVSVWAVFKSMQSLSADDVNITFLKGDDGDPLLEITARDETRRAHPAELDLMDRRAGVINVLGNFLLALANHTPQLRTEARARTVGRLRKALKLHLGIVSDPFYPYRTRSGAGYESRFKVYDKRDNAEERAKREAGFKTLSINGTVGDDGKVAAGCYGREIPANYADEIDFGRSDGRTQPVATQRPDFDVEDDAAGKFIEKKKHKHKSEENDHEENDDDPKELGLEDPEENDEDPEEYGSDSLG